MSGVAAGTATRHVGGGRSPSPSLVGRAMAALACTLACVGPAAAQERPVTGGTYRRPLGNDPASLDPARISDVYSRSVAQQIFDGLVQFDRTLTVAPALAEYWKASRDGLTWTFTLRKGVRFHHGRELTGDDVVFSFTRLLDPRLGSSAADSFSIIRGAVAFRERRSPFVNGLSAPDPHTVRIVLTEPFAPFITMLATGYAKVVPRDLVQLDAERFATHPVGTGAFRFESWEHGKALTLVANQEYFQGPPRLARIIYRVFPGAQAPAMFEEFRRGALEDSMVPTAEHEHVATSREYQYVRRPMFNVRHYGFNTRRRPTDDARVRRAIVAAIDRRAILHDVYAGRFVAAAGVLPPGTLGYNPGLRPTPYDPAHARELLAQAGYPEGRGMPPLVFCSSVKGARVFREHALIRQSLLRIGVRTEFRYETDWRTFTRLMAEGRGHAVLYAWFADIPDPDNFLHLLFHSRSPRNYTGYANPLVDEVLARARREPDLGRRVELYRRAEQVIVDDAVILPIWHQPYDRVFQPYVKSIEVNGLGDPYIPLRKVWLEGRP